MPSTRGFDISIQGIDGTPFRTYGTRSRGEAVYTQIEAKEGLRFQICINPQSPLPEPRDSSTARSFNLRSSKRQDAHDAMEIESDTKPKREYDYWAYIYIDGSEDSEDVCLVPVDPEDQHYHAEGEMYTGRCYQAPKQSDYVNSQFHTTFQILPWMFTSSGIDVLFQDRMNISNADFDISPTSEHDQDMAEIAEALTHEVLSKPASKKPNGQIEIIVKREVIGKKVLPSKHWKRDHRQDSGNGNTHQIIVLEDSPEEIIADTWSTRPYRSDEKFFCKAVFHYHDIKKLVHLGLCDLDGTPTQRRQLRALPARSNDQELPKPSLKRLKGPGDVVTASMAVSDEEGSASSDSDSTSDSDVPRSAKRRRAIIHRRWKPKPGKKTNKMLGWRARQPAKASTELLPIPSLAVFDFNPPLPESTWEVSQRFMLESRGQDEGIVVVDSQLQRVDVGTDAMTDDTEVRD